MDRRARLAELLAKPAYAGLGDADAAAAIMDRTERGPIASENVVRLLLLRDRWAQIVAASRVQDEDARTIAALRMVEALARLQAFDLDVSAYAAAIGAGLDGLVAVDLLSAEDKGLVLALAENQRSPAEVAGLGDVSPADVTEARQDG